MKSTNTDPTRDQRGTCVTLDHEWITVQARINEPEGARFLSSLKQQGREDAVESGLRVGLRALASADHTYTERLLDQKLEAIVTRVMTAAETSIAQATAAFKERWTKAIDEGLTSRLGAHQAALQSSLDRLFSSDRTTSVQADIRRFLTEYQTHVSAELTVYHTKLAREVASAINGSTDPEHPLTKMRAEVEALRKEMAVVLKAAEMAASAIALKREMPKEGFNYQASVHQAVAALMAPSHDEVELFGRRAGATGGADGDLVITLDPRGTRVPVRIAVEVTREASLTVRKLKIMLAKSRVDRAAHAAVVVIERSAVLGGQLLADYPGLGVVVVFDPSAPADVSTLPLRIALKQARVMALQEVHNPVAERNDARIAAEVDKAKSAVELIDNITGNQAQISKLADGTSMIAKDLRRKVTDSLEAIDACLSDDSLPANEA